MIRFILFFSILALHQFGFSDYRVFYMIKKGNPEGLADIARRGDDPDQDMCFNKIFKEDFDFDSDDSSCEQSCKNKNITPLVYLLSIGEYDVVANGKKALFFRVLNRVLNKLDYFNLDDYKYREVKRESESEDTKLALAKILIDHGANVNKYTCNSVNSAPFQLSVESNEHRLVEYFLKNADVDEKYKDNSLFLIVSPDKDKEILDLFIENGITLYYR